MLDDNFYKKEREGYLNKIISSDSRKKLIVAGPGTGKTYTFKKLLEKSFQSSCQKGLVLTFIKNLVKDLEKELGNLADVRTFHSFCRSEVKNIIGKDFEYYPSLLTIIKEDLQIIDPNFKLGKKGSLDNYFYDLDRNIINRALEISKYYKATGHTDSVYRVYQFYQNYPQNIPIYPIILVDEYQDFNLLETSLVEELAKKSPILIVGDDDQALYYFRDSSPKYLRKLAQDNEFERFELPFCSRCPEVIVKAVNRIIEITKELGCLKGRIDKKFQYFPPDKREDSERNPEIINVHCSVENTRCHYAGKYILNEIISMPEEYRKDAVTRGEPAALIIGPAQFLKQVISHFRCVSKNILQMGWSFEEKKEPEGGVELIDGYKILMRNPDSNLGWRIILGNKYKRNYSYIIREAISKRKNIKDEIDKGIRSETKDIINMLNKIGKGNDINEDDENFISQMLGLSVEQIKNKLKVDSEENIDIDTKKPRIFCTTFEGSKGLAAQYVFILGFNEGHFPKYYPPKDIDICRLIVALTRARKRAYILSYGNFAGGKLKRSMFKDYIRDFLSKEIYVDKKYISNISNNRKIENDKTCN
ncbi:MAG: ATP-dependent helicase [Candidatus Aminicenantes bacterium]|nr:ATP-dependent helicase [Candidatus Aminicenantes bacterium]